MNLAQGLMGHKPGGPAKVAVVSSALFGSISGSAVANVITTGSITIPLMKTIIILMLIMSTGRIFYSDFGLFFQVPRDSNALYTTVATLDVFVYRQLQTASTGMAAAAAMMQSVTACVMTLAVNQIVKKFDAESAMI